ncbi:MAG: MgtC/SapB family protein [Pseudomonadota bacterium]
MWSDLWATVVAEFSDISDLADAVRISLRLLVAALLGALIGLEREWKSKSAGVRTHMLVAVGSALFIIGPMNAGIEVGDMSRVIQGVVQGVGFLGAGAIIIGNAQQRTRGLTTAAGVWAAAGIGVAAGLGMEMTAVLSTIIVLLILSCCLLLSAPNPSLMLIRNRAAMSVVLLRKPRSSGNQAQTPKTLQVSLPCPSRALSQRREICATQPNSIPGMVDRALSK